MNEVNDFKYLLKITTENITESYNDLLSTMHPYDVASFHQELNSEYKAYSEKYFNEESLTKLADDVYGIDLTSSAMMDELYEYIHEYSSSLISYKTLLYYIKINDIISGDEYERVFCNS